MSSDVAAPSTSSPSMEEMFERSAPPATPSFKSKTEWLKKPAGIALVTSVVVMILLLIIQPPMVQEKRPEGQGMERQPVSLSKVLFWGIITFALVLLGPFVMSMMNGKKTAEENTSPRN